jgi:hypothetical protein
MMQGQFNCILKLYTSLLVSMLISACATDPKSLMKSERNEQIVMSESVSTVSYRGLNVRCEEGALAGTYIAKLEDADGVYFFGPERSIWSTNEAVQRVPRLYEGGIYMPNNASEPPRFFYILEREVHTAENISAIVQQRNEMVLSSSTKTINAGSLVGNVLGGAVVMLAIEAEIGKINKFPAITDQDVKKKILDGRSQL